MDGRGGSITMTGRDRNEIIRDIGIVGDDLRERLDPLKTLRLHKRKTNG